MKNVLVIGGSVFTGRVFSILASRDGGFYLHVVNRGNFPMELERVAQYKCDRHSAQMIAELTPDIGYDALVDFCAYNPGEISSVIGAIGGRVRQYIYISTASVYVPGNDFIGEGAPLLGLTQCGDDAAGGYIRGKIELERELAEAAGDAGIKYTILRPTFIYGPFNYAPREPYFIELIAKKHAVPVPIDATARFNFIYVIDIARALMACIGSEMAFDEAFNLAGAEPITYAKLISEFERCNGGPFATREVTVAQVNEEKIPLPFPLTEDTLVDGGKFSRAFNFEYTPFREGMEKTFKIFYSLYAT